MKILTILFNFPFRVWDSLDRWLCRSLPGAFQVRWAKLWIRRDEFHPSLDPHADYYMNLNQEKRDAYWNDLARRRETAHKRDLAVT